MQRRKSLCGAACAVVSLALSGRAAVATVTEYHDASQWQNAVGQSNTITFTGWPNFTLLTNQYANFGVVFTQGNDFVLYTSSFVTDGVGVSGGSGIQLSFASPQHGVAVDFPGNVKFQLFSQGTLIYTSNDFVDGFPDGEFGGLVATQSFDTAIITDPSDNIVYIDNLYFGPVLPAPGALPLLAFTAVIQTGRRRRD